MGKNCRDLANGPGFVAEGSQPESAPAGGSAKDSSQIRCICGQSHDKGTMIQCKVSAPKCCRACLDSALWQRICAGLHRERVSVCTWQHAEQEACLPSAALVLCVGPDLQSWVALELSVHGCAHMHTCTSAV